MSTADAIAPTGADVGPAAHAFSAQNIANLERIGLTRDFLGERVREAWVRWAETQPNPKPHWLAPWAELSEADKEADRQIGVAIALWTRLYDSAATTPSESPRPALGEPTQGDARAGSTSGGIDHEVGFA